MCCYKKIGNIVELKKNANAGDVDSKFALLYHHIDTMNIFSNFTEVYVKKLVRELDEQKEKNLKLEMNISILEANLKSSKTLMESNVAANEVDGKGDKDREGNQNVICKNCKKKLEDVEIISTSQDNSVKQIQVHRAGTPSLNTNKNTRNSSLIQHTNVAGDKDKIPQQDQKNLSEIQVENLDKNSHSKSNNSGERPVSSQVIFLI